MIISFIVFSTIIAVSLAAKYTVNGVPVLVNEYMYDIPVHHTPLRAKYALPYAYAPYAPYPAEEPHGKYGLPKVIEIIVPQEIAQKQEATVPVPAPVSVPASAPTSSVHPECIEDEINWPGENREPVVTNYKFDLPPTPAIVQPAARYGVPEVAPAPVKPAPVYGVPEVIVAKAEPAPSQSDNVPEVVVPKVEPAPKEPAPVYGVPEVIIAKVEPAPKEPAPVYGVPEVIVVKAEPAPSKPDSVPEVLVAEAELTPGKPALEYGVPDLQVV